MKVGDICKCISNFTGELSGELILQKNDIVQIHQVIDKLWLEGEGGGCVGKFPSSIVVKTEIPPHPPDAEIYVAFADFAPMQEGDLPLSRGSFITEINLVDEGWAYGESYGRKGVFPLNFAWKINKTLLNEENLSEKPVCIIGKVLTSIKAQLHEELDLWKGDIVTVTHIVDGDYYRGESNGQTGIFPKSFIEIIEERDIEKVTPLPLHDVNSSSSYLPNPINFLTENSADVATVHDDKIDDFNLADVNTNDLKLEDVDTNLSHFSNGKLYNLSKVDPEWKNADATSEDMLDDDYFRVNLPGYHPAANLGAVETSQSNQNLTSLSSNDFQNFDKPSTSYNNQILDPPLIPIDSLSAKVDEYFECSALDNRDNDKAIHEDLLDIDFTGVYTEDNTGINPYGRAVFSFTAKYQNELSFRKGDLIHLIRHIDSHWTVGKLGVLKGIFPTSYIDIIVDCPHKAEDAFNRRTDAIKKAIVCFDYVAAMPEDVSAKEGEVVLIIKFVSDNWVEIELTNGQKGLIPLNHLNVFDDNLSEMPKVNENVAPTPTKRNYSKEDFIAKKNENDIDSQLIKNISSLDISCKHTKPILSGATKPTEDIFSDIKNSNDSIHDNDKGISLDKDKSGMVNINASRTTSLKEIYARVESKKEDRKRVERSSNESICRKSFSETNIKDSSSTVINAKEFPKDVKYTSMPLDRIATDERLDSETSPQRPAPPPPLQSDSENEDYYSLSSGGEDGVSSQGSKIDTEDSVETKENVGESDPVSKYAKKLTMRRELVNELVTTEYEYIHDLESLVQVVKLGQRRKEANAVDLKVLMGNISEVIELSKKFVKELNKVSFNDDEEMLVGPVFIMLATEMCDVYKVYSSNNSISVGPLLKKYQESGDDSSIFLKWVLKELRQHKVNLLDMQAVLIKPVQRVLKYPLFIDNLVQNTPQSHQDYKNLEGAKNQMLNVAKEINEYTKRLDLVAKYRHGSQHSFGEMMQRVSMRSFAKKGARIKTRISATMGLISKTKDLKFEEEESKFRSITKVSVTLTELGTKLAESIRGRHRAEMNIVESIASTLSKSSKISYIETLKNISENICCKILPVFERTVTMRVINPVKKLLCMCSSPEHLIQKRYDKLLNYDKAQHKLDKNKDPAKTRILEEELKIAQGTYEALNTQLLMDLPKLNNHGTSILVIALRTLVAARMNLEGHVTNFYLKLSQSNVFSYLNNEEYLNNFKTKHLELMINLKKLSFVTTEFSPKSPKFVRRKGSLRSIAKRGEKGDRKASSREKLKEQAELTERYDPSMVYIATTNHVPEEQLDILVQQSSLVGVIKMKDPTGRSSRWYVDNGSEKGFVKSCCLQKYYVDQTSPIDNRSNRSSGRPLSNIQTEENKRKKSSEEAVTERPPKYEDIFPPQATSVVHDTEEKVDNVYEEILEKQSLPKASTHRYSNDVSETVHRYEDIEENVAEDDPDPIYETIPADQAVAVGEAEEKQVFFPEPDENEPQFYYALFHFGGNDQTQLPLHEGQVVYLLFAQGSDWWFVEDRTGRKGYVPASYLSKYT